MKKLLTESDISVLADFIEYDIERVERDFHFLQFDAPTYKKQFTDNGKLLADIYARRSRDGKNLEFHRLGGEGELVVLTDLALPLEPYIQHFNESLHEDGKGGGDGGKDIQLPSGKWVDVKTTENSFNGFTIKYFNSGCDFFAFVRFDTRSCCYIILGFATYEAVYKSKRWNSERKCWMVDTTTLHDKGLLYTNIKQILHM